MNIFTAASPASTISVLWDHPEGVEQLGKQHRAVTIAEEENSVTLPIEVAFDVAAEVLGFLMELPRVNGPEVVMNCCFSDE